MSQYRPIEELHPTQLFISKKKLQGILEWLDCDIPTYDPIPVFQYQGRWYLADGHTRTFVLALAGEETVAVTEDETIFEEEPLYRTCIDWCEKAGIYTITDLVGRVVEAETYETKWIQRCQEAANQ